MSHPTDIAGSQILFVTGRLAEHGLREILDRLSDELKFNYELAVMPITVAALMTPAWIAKRLTIPQGTDLVIVPGYCEHQLQDLQQSIQVPLQVGPHDMRKIPRTQRTRQLPRTRLDPNRLGGFSPRTLEPTRSSRSINATLGNTSRCCEHRSLCCSTFFIFHYRSGIVGQRRT